MPKRKWVRRPLVQLDARGRVATHGRQTPVRGIWHTTECNDAPGIRELEGVVGFWQRQGRGFGTQLIIDADGNSALCGNPNQLMYGAKGANLGTVHVELIGFARFVPRIWWARLKQLNKLAKWMAWLNLEYGIPLEESTTRGWSGHNDHPAGGHWDPGKWFPRKYVLRKARQFRQNGWT
jgi:hypothetical protein